MSQRVFEGVAEIMTGLFALEPGVLTMDSSMESVEQWDSLQHINVILDVEQKFDIVLSPDEVMQLHTVRSIVEIVEAKRAVAGAL